MRYQNEAEGTEDLQLTRCPIAGTLNILNQRWTLHIVQSLLSGKKRFNELVRTLGVNACTLRNRLRELERKGVVHRQVVRAIPPNVEYSLTDKGMALHNVIVAIEHWGKKWQPEDQAAAKLPATDQEVIEPVAHR